MQHIQKNGLSPTDISRVFGASGAAKWLAIVGLDQAVFGRWLPASMQQVALYGTSVGAFKLAAAAHDNPERTLAALADAYIEQRYRTEKVTPDAIAREMRLVTDVVSNEHSAAQVLNHPTLRFQCGTVRCLSTSLASQNPKRQQRAMLRLFGSNSVSRERLSKHLELTVFADPRLGGATHRNQDAHTTHVDLSTANYNAALLASGSLPVYMHPQIDILGAPSGVYRDGGLVDYHPVPTLETEHSEDEPKLALYPHFYPRLVEGWFDKFLPWRKVDPAALTDVIMLSPSTEFVASLEGGAIPDRHDFARFSKDEDARIRRWRKVVERSEELGQQFLDWTASGEIADQVQPITF